jgi:hypothetical protein
MNRYKVVVLVPLREETKDLPEIWAHAHFFIDAENFEEVHKQVVELDYDIQPIGIVQSNGIDNTPARRRGH